MFMNPNIIKALLEKYWEGTTTIAEEQSLKAYFNQANIAADLKPYQALFQSFKAGKQTMLSDDFEADFIQKIRAESIAKPMAKRRHLYFRVAQIAAVVSLLIGCFYMFQQPITPAKKGAKMIVFDDNPADAKAALNTLKAALALVSKKTNKGREQAALGLKEMAKVSAIVQD